MMQICINKNFWRDAINLGGLKEPPGTPLNPPQYRKINVYKASFHRNRDKQCQRLILIYSLGSESRCHLIKLPFSLVFTFLSFCSLIFGSNLDETTRSVYKENVRLNAALDFHLREGQELKKVCLLLHCKLFYAENSNHGSLPLCTIYPPLNCSITRV